jgi:hypothetical protein
VAAARHAVAVARAACHDVRVVVRLTRHHRFDIDALASVVGGPVAAVVPSSRRVRRAANDGSGVLVGWHVAQRYARLLDSLRSSVKPS